MKKAQLTLFVIVAIVIIAVIALLYSGDILQKIEEVGIPDQVKSIKADIDSCVEQSAKEALGLISMQGGYIVPDNYYTDGTLHVAYWYDKADISPTLDKIEEELSETTCVSLFSCLDFEKYNLIEMEECEARTTIKTDEILIDVNYPITIDVADKTYILQDFSAKIEARLGKIYDVARAVVAEHAEHPDEVCLTCLADVGEENDVYVKSDKKEESLITTIIDENSKVYEPEAYEFRFAMK